MSKKRSREKREKERRKLIGDSIRQARRALVVLFVVGVIVGFSAGYILTARTQLVERFPGCVRWTYNSTPEPSNGSLLMNWAGSLSSECTADGRNRCPAEFTIVYLALWEGPGTDNGYDAKTTIVTTALLGSSLGISGWAMPPTGVIMGTMVAKVTGC